jgi:hypothetical protein
LSKNSWQELKLRLADIQISGVSGQGNRELYKEIDEHDAKLAQTRKESKRAEQRVEKLTIISEQLKNFTKKILTKLDALPGQDQNKFQIQNMTVEVIPQALVNIEQRLSKVIDSLNSNSDFKALLEISNTSNHQVYPHSANNWNTAAFGCIRLICSRFPIRFVKSFALILSLSSQHTDGFMEDDAKKTSDQFNDDWQLPNIANSTASQILRRVRISLKASQEILFRLFSFILYYFFTHRH